MLRFFVRHYVPQRQKLFVLKDRLATHIETFLSEKRIIKNLGIDHYTAMVSFASASHLAGFFFLWSWVNYINCWELQSKSCSGANQVPSTEPAMFWSCMFRSLFQCEWPCYE